MSEPSCCGRMGLDALSIAVGTIGWRYTVLGLPPQTVAAMGRVDLPFQLTIEWRTVRQYEDDKIVLLADVTSPSPTTRLDLPDQ